MTSVAGRIFEFDSNRFGMTVGPSNDWIPQALATRFAGLHEVARVSYKAFGLPSGQLSH